jgi:hypothetical protein
MECIRIEHDQENQCLTSVFQRTFTTLEAWTRRGEADVAALMAHASRHVQERGLVRDPSFIMGVQRIVSLRQDEGTLDDTIHIHTRLLNMVEMPVD